jgi:O-antigen/teichoic acid export membrane protein
MSLLSRLKARLDARLARHGELGARLIKGFLGTGGIRLAHAAIGFATGILLARSLGPSNYGTYTFVMAMVGFLTIPSELGIPGLAVREIAVANARKDWGAMRGFILRAHQGIAALSLILIALGALGLVIFGDGIDPVRRQCMWLALALVPLISLGALRGAMLRGLRKVLLGQLPEQVIRPAALLLAVVLILVYAGESMSPQTMLLAQIAATTVAFAWGLAVFVRHRPPQLAAAQPTYRTSAWVRSTLPFGLSAALLLLNGRTDILALGLFHPDSAVGVYRVAVQLTLPVLFAQQAVNAIQAPHIAHLYAAGDMKRLQAMVTQSSRAVLAVSAFAALVVILFGKPLIRLLFGAEYAAAYLPLVILAVGKTVNSAMGSVASLLNMTGHERDAMRSILIAAVLNVTLNVTLTPVWGMTGAAIATAATLVVWNVVMWHTVWKRIGIQSSAFLRRAQ